MRTSDDRNVVCWSDVVAGSKGSALGEVEEQCYIIGASGEGKATAHGVIIEEDTFKELAFP